MAGIGHLLGIRNLSPQDLGAAKPKRDRKIFERPRFFRVAFAA